MVFSRGGVGTTVLSYVPTVMALKGERGQGNAYFAKKGTLAS